MSKHVVNCIILYLLFDHFIVFRNLYYHSIILYYEWLRNLFTDFGKKSLKLLVIFMWYSGEVILGEMGGQHCLGCICLP